MRVQRSRHAGIAAVDGIIIVKITLRERELAMAKEQEGVEEAVSSGVCIAIKHFDCVCIESKCGRIRAWPVGSMCDGGERRQRNQTKARVREAFRCLTHRAVLLSCFRPPVSPGTQDRPCAHG